MSRHHFFEWLLTRSFFDWFMAILILCFLAGAISEGTDWLDQRSCRVDGGQVIRDERDWHCEGRK